MTREHGYILWRDKKNTILVIGGDAVFPKNMRQFASPYYYFDLNRNTAWRCDGRGGLSARERASEGMHSALSNKDWTYNVMIILHLDRVVVWMLWICRHSVVRNMGTVVNLRMCSWLYLDRLYEQRKKIDLILGSKVLIRERPLETMRGRKEYYSPRTEGSN